MYLIKKWLDKPYNNTNKFRSPEENLQMARVDACVHPDQSSEQKAWLFKKIAAPIHTDC